MQEVIAREVTDRKLSNPGEFHFCTSQHHGAAVVGMEFVCPCGCGKHGMILFKNYPKAVPHEQRWEWDRNERQPTVSPSILLNDCGWSGNLKAGMFQRAA